MNALFIVSALIELSAGLALLLWPFVSASAQFDTPAALVLGRLAGLALLALGVACWLGRREEKSRAANGLVAAMLLFNAGAVALISYARLSLGLFSAFIWPVAMLHAVMAVWCIACLRSKRV
jgi:hypothetical protein